MSPLSVLQVYTAGNVQARFAEDDVSAAVVRVPTPPGKSWKVLDFS